VSRIGHHRGSADSAAPDSAAEREEKRRRVKIGLNRPLRWRRGSRRPTDGGQQRRADGQSVCAPTRDRCALNVQLSAIIHDSGRVASSSVSSN
jgi:hypothetical protein